MQINPFVLLAEDDFIDEMSLKRIFNNLNVFRKIEVVNNGKELINFLEKNQELPEVIITDSKMPVMDGISAIKYIRQNPDYAKILIILVSSSFSKDEIEVITSLPNTLYFVKPGDAIDYSILARDILKSLAA
jgi:CheY-like chemotaxis protein